MADLGNSLELVISMVVRGVAVEEAAPLPESDDTDVVMLATLPPNASLDKRVIIVVTKRSQRSWQVSRCYLTEFITDNLGNSSLDVVARHLDNLVTRDMIIPDLTSNNVAEDVEKVVLLLDKSSVTGVRKLVTLLPDV